MAEVAAIKDTMAAAEDLEKQTAAELKAILEILPNLPADDVPVGASEDDNRIEREGSNCHAPQSTDKPASRHEFKLRDLGFRSVVHSAVLAERPATLVIILMARPIGIHGMWTKLLQ